MAVSIGEENLLALYRVARTLAESDSLLVAAPVILRDVCETLGWEVGLLWKVDPAADVLRFVDLWRAPTVRVDSFETASRGWLFKREIGLPGRVWATGKPAWIIDVVNDPNFPRVALAVECGLHAAFAFPVRLGEQVLGVFEFFARGAKPPDDALLTLMDGVGSQIGQFDERRRVEAALATKAEQLQRAYELLGQQHEELNHAHLQLSEAHLALKTANEQLAERNQELDDFAHTVAHDLRTPLSAVIGWARIISEGGAGRPDDVLTLGQRILAQAKRMNGIIGELFLLAEGRRSDIPLERVDMGVVVSNVLQRLEYMIEQYDATVVTPGEWPVALGYAPWTEEIWANYISNAIKYGGKPPQIELAACRTGAVIRFVVRDNGPGIPADALPRLFQPSESRRHREMDGHGLGLPIVASIAKRLGGELGARSLPGAGSEFHFSLPAA